MASHNFRLFDSRIYLITLNRSGFASLFLRWRILTVKGEQMLAELKNLCSKLADSYKEKRLRKQKALMQMKMMSGYIIRVK